MVRNTGGPSKSSDCLRSLTGTICATHRMIVPIKTRREVNRSKGAESAGTSSEELLQAAPPPTGGN
eukprot:5843829-Prymnesium_polylepis.1